MKLPLLFVSMCALIACQSEPKPAPLAEPIRPAADPASEVFDLTPCAERPMTAEEFVKRCQVATGFNFTYAQDTQAALRAQEVQFEGPARVTAEDFESFLAAQLSRCGLSCRPVGPASLRVFLVERSKSS